MPEYTVWAAGLRCTCGSGGVARAILAATWRMTETGRASARYRIRTGYSDRFAEPESPKIIRPPIMKTLRTGKMTTAAVSATAVTFWTMLCVVLWAGPVGAKTSCTNPFVNGDNGPYDYTDPVLRDTVPISLQEDFHFTPSVQRGALGGGLNRNSDAVKPDNNVGGDLDFMLRAWPNHHKALYAMVVFQLRLKREKSPVLSYMHNKYGNAECYLKRAVIFQPKDASAFSIYGTYLQLSGRRKEALEKFKTALTLSPESGQAHYNLGLSYLSLKRYDEAVTYAKKAMELGYRKTQLRDRLRRAGKWPK